MKTKTLAKEIKKHADAIAKHRDALAELIVDAETYIEDSNEGLQSLEMAVEYLSRSV